MSTEFISASSALEIAQKASAGFCWLDVRSEKEFAAGALPFSHNIPILNDEHRHQVGLTYKHQGKHEAVGLGHRLADPLRESLVHDWREVLTEQAPSILFCWRGGMRSGIAQQWLNEAGIDTLRVKGGYKAIRQLLLQRSEKLPPLLVLSGKTGSHKTKLLQSLPSGQTVDLEQLAQHRGSAFGFIPGSAGQPSQATFENRLLFSIARADRSLVIEDESRLIGVCHLPDPLYDAMARAPRVVIDTPVDQRARNIVSDYIEAPLKTALISSMELKTRFLTALNKIHRKLGGVLYQELNEQMSAAFTDPFDLSAHQTWVAVLLERYYDKAYDFAFQRKNCQVLFQGSFEECRQWLQDCHE